MIRKHFLMTIALLCTMMLPMGFAACSSDDNNNDVEAPETDEYKVFDDLSYFQRAIVQMDPLGKFLYFHYGKVLYPNDRGHLYIGVNSWEEAEKIFRSWIAPDVVLSNVAPSSRALKGELTDTLGNAQLTVYLQPGEGLNVAECTVSDESQLEHFTCVSFIDNSDWPEDSGENNWKVGDVVLGLMIHDRDCDMFKYVDPGCNCINNSLDDKDKMLNFVCLREQSNGVKPLFAAITAHDGYKCGGGIYPSYVNIRESDYTPNESEAGTIRSLLNSNWDFFVSAFKEAGFGPLTEGCDYFIDKKHYGGFLNLVTYYDTYSYKTGYINGILVGGSRRFLLYFDNLSDDEIDDFEIVCR